MDVYREKLKELELKKDENNSTMDLPQDPKVNINDTPVN